MRASHALVEVPARYPPSLLFPLWVSWSEGRLFVPSLASRLHLLSPPLASSAVVPCVVLTSEAHFQHPNEKLEGLLQAMAVVSWMAR
jgi:hypothetical protein